MSAVLKDSLASSRLFRGLPDRIIDDLAEAAIRKECRRGERIFAQGDEGNSLYCVVSGRVRIGATGLEGQEVFLNEIRPGDCFGELELLDGLPRMAGALAAEPTVLLAVHRSSFLRLLNEDRQMSAHCLSLFCERMRWTIGLYEDTAFLSSQARLAKHVLRLAMCPAGQPNGALELAISQSDLARFLGMSRKLVNRHLQEWKGRGWIDIARTRLFIRDPQALQGLTSGQASADNRPDSSNVGMLPSLLRIEL